MNDRAFLAPRRCLLEPVEAIFEAARLLDQAASAHVAGDRRTADALLRAADLPLIAEWTKKIWGKFDQEIHRYREVPGAPPLLTKVQRKNARMPSAEERRALIARDGHRCRFCGIPVIEPRVRKAIQKIYPDSCRWGGREAEQHAAFQCMWLQFDHLLPHSRGGDNSLENVVITCAPCNFGRCDWTLEETGLIDPRTRAPETIDWDGLERFLS
ncbi:HNH endonuclease [Limibaculum sp. M0105]|uniref:HNH endonuclease n=1 Tax=Thermohalobaculum xanthum TaxID=2753746 RepID=A0A8J7MAJ3_9RHOB|nr:HNH endonuclease [Thermohalobaculum xanthum]MBK0401211.1 HNH endonuclease [Thermohalobaculum xanthum]